MIPGYFPRDVWVAEGLLRVPKSSDALTQSEKTGQWRPKTRTQTGDWSKRPCMDELAKWSRLELRGLWAPAPHSPYESLQMILDWVLFFQKLDSSSFDQIPFGGHFNGHHLWAFQSADDNALVADGSVRCVASGTRKFT